MQITWLGHGTFLFRLPSGQVIVMDPWTDGNPKFPKGFEIDRVDAPPVLERGVLVIRIDPLVDGLLRLLMRTASLHHEPPAVARKGARP